MENGGMLNTTEFVSRSADGVSPGRSPRRPKGTKRGKKGKTGGAAFLLVRLGICAAALAGVLWIKFSGGGEALAVLADASQTEPAGDPSQLGKLRFVELPSILDVFAPSDRAVVPVNASGFEPEGDGGGLVIRTAAGGDVVSPLAGRIAAEGEDPKLGKYVTVSVGGDIEITVYGLSELCAERGQPVKQRQKLGTALNDTVTVRAWHAGRPLDAASLFGIGAAG